MSYIETLKNSAEKFKSLVCLGLDPVIDDIPISGEKSNSEKILIFYREILNKIIQKNIYPGAVKPNYAFYAQYGIEGINNLAVLISEYQDAGLPVILDVKRGDIGKTAKAYAHESFDFFGADAVTLAPYMGYDSIRPFIENYPDKGYYVLTKTSNKSSGDIQDLIIEDEPVYMKVAHKIIDWYHPGLGSVIGATYPDQLQKISDIFINSGYEIPLLIPGIGAQGGSLESVMNILNLFDDASIHRINSSSGINYAYKHYKDMHYADAAITALDDLNNQINSLRE